MSIYKKARGAFDRSLFYKSITPSRIRTTNIEENLPMPRMRSIDILKKKGKVLSPRPPNQTQDCLLALANYIGKP